MKQGLKDRLVEKVAGATRRQRIVALAVLLAFLVAGSTALAMAPLSFTLAGGDAANVGMLQVADEAAGATLHVPPSEGVAFPASTKGEPTFTPEATPLDAVSTPRVTYVVRFDPNGADEGSMMDDAKVTVDEGSDWRLDLPTSSLQREGWHLLGWSTTPDGKDIEDDPATEDVDESFVAMPVPDASQLHSWTFEWDADEDGKAETYDLAYAAFGDDSLVEDGAQTTQVLALYAQWEQDPEPEVPVAEDDPASEPAAPAAEDDPATEPDAPAASDEPSSQEQPEPDAAGPTEEDAKGAGAADADAASDGADASAEAAAPASAPAPITRKSPEAPTASEVSIASGTWGDVSWQVLSADSGYTCRLVLSGEGATPLGVYIPGTSYYSGELTSSDAASDPRPWKSYLDRITQVEVGEGVTSLTKGTFSHMSNLQSATLPSTLTSIPDFLFAGDASLSSVTFPSGSNVTYIWGYAFVLCSSLRSFEIPQTVTYVGEAAFARSGLETVTLPEACTSFASARNNDATTGVFADCPNLTSVAILGNITAVWNYTFYGSSNLSRVVLPDSVQTIEEGAFVGTGITSASPAADEPSLKLPANLRKVDAGAFANTPSLTSVTLPASVQTLSSVLKGMDALSSVTITSADVATLDASGSAFAPSSAAAHLDVRFASSVDALSGAALADLSSARNARFAFEGPNVFTYTAGSANLSGVPQPLATLADGIYYADQNGLLYLLDTAAKTAKLCYVPFGLEQATVPASLSVSGEADDTRNGTYAVTGVSSLALASASDLTSLTVEDPTSLTDVAADAFASCPSLTSLNGKTQKAEAEALLTGVASTGGARFAGTGLGGNSGGDLTRTAGTIEVSNNGVNVAVSLGRDTSETQHDPAQDADGVHQYYTSAHGVMTVSVSTPDSQQAAGTTTRVYMQFSDADGTINWPMGTQQVTDDSTGTKLDVTFSRCADLANTLIVDIPTPEAGATFSFNTNITYPSPSSDGGTVKVTTKVLSADQKEQLGLGYALPDDSTNGKKEYIEAHWDTKPDAYQTTKAAGENASIVQNAAGKFYVEGMTFSVADARVEEQVEDTFGKDYLRSVSYEDVLTLPEGASWNQEMLEAIRSHAYSMVRYNSNNDYALAIEATVDGKATTLFRVTVPNASSIPNVIEAKVDENNNVHLIWTSENATNGSADIATQKYTVAFGANTVMVDEAHATAGDAVSIQNTVTTTARRYHSGPVTQEASAAVDVASSDASLTVAKNGVGGAEFGEATPWTVTVANEGGRFYQGPIKLTDTLGNYNDYFYVTGTDLDEMYRQLLPGDALTLTITGARFFSTAPQTVTDTTGEQRTADLPSSGSNSSYGKPSASQGSTDEPDLVAKNCKITIVSDPQNPGHATVSLVSGTNVDGSPTTQRTQQVSSGAEAIALLSSWGYSPTRNARYALELTTHDLTLASHDQYQFVIYAHAKTTLMLLTADQEIEYNHMSNGRLWGSNKVTMTDKEGESTSATSSSVNLYRELSVSKTAASEDEVGTMTGAASARVTTYTLSYQNKAGSTTELYDALPLIDSLSGSQAIMAPVEQNPGLDGRGLGTTTRDGVTYWTIDQPGTYRNVQVGTGKSGETLTADTITVTREDNGTFSTVAKWYFHDDNSYGINRQVTFMTRAALDWQDGETSRMLEDVVFLGDHGSHRLWERYGEVAERYGIEKQIVTDKKVESDPTDDETVVSSVMHGGQSITYRLKVHNQSNAITIFDAAALRDKLPLAGGWAWSRENIQVEFVKTEYSQAQGNVDSWYVTQDDGSDASEDGQYYLVFGGTGADTCRLIVQPGADAYIYVTLTTPSGDVWEDFAAAHTSDSLSNTFQAFGKESTVKHEIAGHGSAFLQKGVFATSSQGVNGGGTAYDYTDEWSRFYYSNDDFRRQYVTYYVTLANSGSSRLYLNDIQDKLPQGFRFAGFRYNNTNESSATSYGNVSTSASIDYNDGYVAAATMPDEKAYQFVDFNVSCSHGDGGWLKSEDLRFSVKRSSDRYAKYPISYDEATGKCYLMPGQAICFAYVAHTNIPSATQDVSTNQVGMELDEHAMEDFTLDTGSQVTSYNPSSVRANDGERGLADASEVAKYGFETTSSTSKWLTSNVTVRRGSIVPGISKAATSRTDANTGVVTPNPSGAISTDIIGWTVRASNTGNLTMQDYVISDVVQAPYLITGDVYFSIEVPQAKDPSQVDTLKVPQRGGPLLTITDTQVAADGTTTVTYNPYYYDGTKMSSQTLIFAPGKPSERKTFALNVNGRYPRFYLTMRYDENGNEVFSLEAGEYGLGLPAGATAVMKLSTKNSSGEVRNGVFYNTGYLTPVGQSFDGNSVTRGSVVDFDVKTSNDPASPLPSVRSSSLINVSYGFITSSVKRVAQKDDPANAAASNVADGNAITLAARDKVFTYSLDVGNTTGKAMNSLVLIDSLPQQGDHSVFTDTQARDSEYQVDFAADPAPAVTVTAKDGSVQTLDPSAYTVEYSDATTFATEDWEGAGSGAGWGSNPAGKRSLRVTLKGTADAVIPADATVTLSFDAIVNRDAQATTAPGAIAWNSFGYRYGLEGVAQMLLSAPMNVGVRLPWVPSVTKALVSGDGTPAVAKGDQTFAYVAFEGGVDGLALNGAAVDAARLDALSDAELAQALTESGRKATYVQVTVPDGKSEADPVSLWGARVATYDGAQKTWTQSTEAFPLVDGQTYTVVEVGLDGNGATSNGQWRTKSMDLASGTTLASGKRFATFAYDYSAAQHIASTNERNVWRVDVVKRGELSAQPLEGAVFALYSPNLADLISVEDFEKARDEWGFPQTYIESMIVKGDGTTGIEGTKYYLARVVRTDANGTLALKDLDQGTYELHEFAAPEGYGVVDPVTLAWHEGDASGVTGTVVRPTDNGVTVTLDDPVAYDLPSTGGTGVASFAFAGVVLLAAATHLARKVRRQA